jgi:hypothetical protein
MFAESFGSPFPATRLDVQRSYQEDKRAGYAFMNPDPRDDRENRFSLALRAIGEFVVSIAVHERRRSRHVTVSVPESQVRAAETAESVS